MRRTRRIIAAAGIAATIWLPLNLAAATPAAAYCENDPVELSDGSGGSNNGCSNTCMDLARAYQKLTKQPAPFDCLQ